MLVNIKIVRAEKLNRLAEIEKEFSSIQKVLSENIPEADIKILLKESSILSLEKRIILDELIGVHNA